MKMEPIDKKLTNHAWGEMQKLLDQEMPVAKRRRRFAWWWMALGFALVVATGAAAFFLDRSGTEAQPSAEVAPMVAESTQQPEQQAAATGFSEGKMTEARPPNAISSDTASTAKAKSGAPQMAPTPEPQAAAKEASGQEAPFFAEKTTESESTPAPVPSEASPVRPELLAPGALGLLAIQPLPIEQQDLPAANVEFALPHRVVLTAQASAFTAPNSGARGLGAGLLATLPLGKSRFSIETGLAFNYLQQPLFIVADEGSTDIDPTTLDPIFQYNDTRITFENSAVSNFDALSEQNQSSIRLKNRLDLYYLRLPVEVSYRSNRLRATVGMNTGLLLVSSSDFTTGGLLLFNKNNRLDRSTGGSGIFADLSEKIKVRTLDLAAVGGLGYDLSPTLGIDLRYRLGLTDVLPDNNAKDFNRFVQLSLRYRIGGVIREP